jgi:hypothetical protein
MAGIRERDARDRLSRRNFLRTSCGLLGLSLPAFLQMRARAARPESGPEGTGRAKACIVLYCWGGMSHLDTWDLKPDAPREVRGLFKPIPTATPGIQVTEHLPLLAWLTGHLAIVRSIHHDCTAHGKGMYWNLTGHPPPQPEAAVNLPPSRDDWPSLGAMVSRFREAPRGMPRAVNLPYPLVDNGTLQAGESAGWLGSAHDPIVIRTPAGKPFGGVSRDLGSPVFQFAEGTDSADLRKRRDLLGRLDVTPAGSPTPFGHFRELALDMLLDPRVRRAFDLDREDPRLRERYGDHIGGQSMLLARRLVEAGVPIVTVVCAAGDLNGSKGDHWDTHGDNFNRLENTMLPTFDRAASALLTDLHARGLLDETLVVMTGDFGRTPKVNGGAGRDHYPYCYSVVLAGGGIRGGQVYGSSDRQAAFPHTHACGPNDLHATIFRALGVSLDSRLHDRLGRPHPITNGKPLPLF